MEEFTLRIDPASRDISFDEGGIMQTVSGDEAIAQNVRLTLEVWRGEFPLVPNHGTDYDRILGKKPNELEDDEVPEVVRDAIFQEPGVAEIDAVDYKIEGRSIEVAATGRLSNGDPITMEVRKQ